MQMLVHAGLTNNEVVYFGGFEVEHVPKELEKFIRHKNIKTNMLRIQSNNSKMCGYFYIGFSDFVIANKSMIEFNCLFSPYDFEKNDNIFLTYFENERMQFH